MAKKKVEIPPVLPYTVIRDSREKQNHGWMFPETTECTGTVIETLKTGDYTLANWQNDFVIERKATTSELATNIYESRFERELERLDSFKYPFIICEFSFDDVAMFPINSGIPKSIWHRVKLSADYMQNCLAKWQIQHKVKIIFAGKNGDIAAKKLFKYITKYGNKD